MAGLTVTRVEETALRVVSITPCSGGGHSVITYEKDGVQKTIHVDNSLLNVPVPNDPEAERTKVIEWCRDRIARGKPTTGIRII